MSKIKTKRNKRIERIEIEFHAAVQDAPASDPFIPEGRESWKQWADQCRNFEADLAAEGVVL